MESNAISFENAGSYGEVRDGKLFGPQGGLQGMKGLENFFEVRRRHTAAHAIRVNEAARLYADAINGRVDPIFIREAITPSIDCVVRELMVKYPGIYGYSKTGRSLMGIRETMSVTDYQALFTDVLDRLYYGFYSAWPIPNKGLVRIHQLRDFRLVSRYLLDGVVTPLTAMDAAAPPPQRALSGPVPQDGATAAAAGTGAPLQYQPKLYQAMTSVNWRAFINDDLGIFRDLSNRLAIAGNRGISKFITSLYMDANGPNALLYTAAYANQVIRTNGASVNNPSLSSQGIMDALKVLALQRDSGGDPIMITGKLRLWYGPRYVAVAENLMNATKMMLQNEGGTGNAAGFPTQFLEANNWLIRNMELVQDPYIPIVCTTAGVQDTSWGITVDPDSQNRPNSEVGFLQGYEVPQIMTKVGNTARQGGGVDSMLGDFMTMDSDMKIVTVFGGTQIDGRSTVASTGQGV